MPIRFPVRSFAAMALSLITSLPVLAEGQAGPYLAARHADFSGDFSAVVEYGTRALARDPGNIDIMEGLLIAQIGLGDFDMAIPVARRLQSLFPQSQVAGLVLLGDAMKREDWDGVIQTLEKGTTVGELMDSMISAWAKLGQGQMSQALDIFQSLSDDPGSKMFVLFHQALAYALVGDYENAARILSGDEGPLQLNRRGVFTYVQVLSQSERFDDAIDLLDKVYSGAQDPEIEALHRKLAAHEAIAFDAISSPRDGMAEVFFTVGDSLAGEVEANVVLLYSRMAEYLIPGNVPAALLSASQLEKLELFDLAVDAYGQIGPDDRAYPQAVLGRAEALRHWGKVDESIGELRALARAYPDLAPIHVTLGDTLRFEKRYGEAAAAYDDAIALYETPLPDQWSVYFSRAIAFEREGSWPAAEADFRKALELKPGQPNVLNYLGYSYVEMQTNLDEALDMIERAVAARPGDGYITDSLGWVYYRTGRYDEAVEQMERAVELMPVDAIVNDHLGDVYWAVNRKREAEFQWRRALSFDPEEEEAVRIRRKLEIGLDATLEEEGAAPLTRTDEDG